jgi:hypothetical protein
MDAPKAWFQTLGTMSGIAGAIGLAVGVISYLILNSVMTCDPPTPLFTQATFLAPVASTPTPVSEGCQNLPHVMGMPFLAAPFFFGGLAALAAFGIEKSIVK